MLVDAVVLAGGRSSRLGAVPKAALRFGGETLLERTLSAVAFARRVVIVGPEQGLASADLDRQAVRPIWTRENPPFAGPVAAIAAGLTALEDPHAARSDIVLVVACDMPHVDLAIRALRQALEADSDPQGRRDGVIAVTEEADGTRMRQVLVGAYSTDRLTAAIADLRRLGSLDSLPVHRLLGGLDLREVPVAARATDDVDTWDDAERLGVERPAHIR